MSEGVGVLRPLFCYLPGRLTHSGSGQVAAESISIIPLVSRAAPASAKRDITGIFYATSTTQSFADDAARLAFEERWLGRYLRHDPDLAFIAIEASNQVVGYIVGAVADPAVTPRFSDLDFFRDWRHLTARYPAHLHVNLIEDARGRGIGAQLIEKFCTEARRRGAPGVHVVTTSGMRNVSFYNRVGFEERGRLARPSGDLVFLGRLL